MLVQELSRRQEVYKSRGSWWSRQEIVAWVFHNVAARNESARAFGIHHSGPGEEHWVHRFTVFSMSWFVGGTRLFFQGDLGAWRSRVCLVGIYNMSIHVRMEWHT